MTAIASITTSPTALLSTKPPRSLYRMSLAKYEAMVQSGIFTKRDRLVLIDVPVLIDGAEIGRISVATILS